MPRNAKAWTCLAVLLLAAAAGAAPPAAGEDLADTLGGLVERLRAETGATVGAHVVRLSDGATLFDLSGSRPMLPASNQKILTSAVALKRLGPDFRFRSILAEIGGDLVVFGDGDPTTGDPRLCAAKGETIYGEFDRWASAVHSAGLDKVGNLVVHAGIFQPPVFHPDWPEGQRQRWYSAPVAGANFNDNCLDIGFEVRQRQVTPMVAPLSRFIDLRNRVRLGSKHVWSCRYRDGVREVTLSGTVTQGTSEPLSVAMPDPAGLFGCVLADRLARGGVNLTGAVLTDAHPGAWRGPPEKARVLAASQTALSDVLDRCNKQSLNMMAECLFLRCAVEGATPATWDSAARTARQVLASEYALDARQFVVADGSGYSRRNRASPGVLTALLRRLRDQPAFLGSLSVAGVDGSMGRRLGAAGWRGRVLGKTGSLAGVSALSGYVLDARGQPVLAFSVLTNGRTTGKTTSAEWLEDSLCQALIRWVDAPATRPASTPATTTASTQPGAVSRKTD